MNARRQIAASRARGFSLVELMVALALGLIISASILTAYVSASRNFAADERHARMQENARFALRVLSADLAMADFWGQLVATDAVTTTLALTPGDCGEAPALLDATGALLFNNRHGSTAATHFTPCATVSDSRYASSDVVLIKRVAGSATARSFVDTMDSDGDGDTSEVITTGAGDLEAGTVYLRTNGASASLVDDASPTNPPAAGQSDWRYMPRLYFVRAFYESPGDGIPALCRLELDALDFDAQTCLAEGIEDLHVEFGLDTDADGDANLYTATPSPADMEDAVSARIHVLVRSNDEMPHYTNPKSYQLGGVTIAAFDDGYLRNVFTTSVALRNSAYRSPFK